MSTTTDNGRIWLDGQQVTDPTLAAHGLGDGSDLAPYTPVCEPAPFAVRGKTGPKPRPAAELRQVAVKVYGTPAEVEGWRERAQAAGVPLAEWIRSRLGGRR